MHPTVYAFAIRELESELVSNTPLLLSALNLQGRAINRRGEALPEAIVSFAANGNVLATIMLSYQREPGPLSITPTNVTDLDHRVLGVTFELKEHLLGKVHSPQSHR